MSEEEKYQTVNVGDQAYNFPKDMGDDEISGILKKEYENFTLPEEAAEVAPAYKPFATVPDEIEAGELINNNDWMTASSQLFRVMTRKPFEGSQDELAEWSREFMADFNYNIVDTGVIAHRLGKSEQIDKEAFLYMMDTFDNTNMSWEGAGNAVGSILTDPTTYAGLATLGAGLAVKQGAKVLGKEALKFQLKKSIGRTGLVAGTESAAYSFYDNRIRQNVEVDAGRKAERDTTESIIATGVGFGVGFTFGVGLDLVAQNVAKLFANGKVSALPIDAPTTTKVEEIPEPKDKVDSDEEIGDALEEVVEPEKAIEPENEGVITVGGLDLPAYAKTLDRRSLTLEEAVEFAEEVSDQIVKMDPNDAEGIANALGLHRLTLRETEELATAAQKARNELTDRLDEALLTKLSKNTPEATTEAARLAELQKNVEGLDALLRNTAGYMLRARQEQNTLYNGLTLDNIRRELIASNEGKEVSELVVETEFLKRRLTASTDFEQQKLTRQFDDEARQLLKDGDLKGAMNKALEKNKALDKLSDLVQETEPGLAAKLVEGSIGNVFSFTTLQINAFASSVKSLAMPAARALLDNPLELSTRKQMTAAYSAMLSTNGGAWRAAIASYRLEQSLLTRDPNKYLENALAIKGKTGGAARFFIRMTTATDEYLSQLNYSSFIAGRAASEATIKAQAAGLKGKALNAAVKQSVKEALEGAYRQVDAEQALIPVITKGKNLKLSGKELEDFVRKEIARDPQALRVADLDDPLNKEAATYLRDVLYKREASGEGLPSSAMAWFEEGMNKMPTLKLITGQLFIRTPIRVFEEAVRITPAVQFLAPRFVSDMRGLNGPERQLRARAESMASIAMLGTVMSLYSEGRIAGGGSNTAWQQDSLQRDSAEPDLYTITDEDGSTWSYRFFDPIATPMKAIVTGLEQLDRLRIRQAQGEELPANALENAVTYISIAGMGMMKAIKDANLLAGFSGFVDAGEAIVNPEGKPSGWLRYMGDKMRLAVPATIRKASLVNNNEGMRDPATILQMAQAQLIDPFINLPLVNGSGGEITSFAYDHMGRRKTITDIGLLHNIFSKATVEEREKGRSEAEVFVDKELKRLQDVTGVVFSVPNKHSSTGGLDYRTVLTKDGTETLYDRWNVLYNETVNFDALANVLKAPLPDGTMRHKGARVEFAKNFLTTARNLAHTKLKAEQRQVIDEQLRFSINKTRSKAGLFDADRRTNPTPIEQLLGQ